MRYLARRIGLFVVTLWAALTVNFLIPRVMPGNEASAVLGTFRTANPAALHALEIQFGVNVHQSVFLVLLPIPRKLPDGPVRGHRPGGAGIQRDRLEAPLDAGPGRGDDDPRVPDRHARGRRQRVVPRRPARRHPAAVPVHHLDGPGLLRRPAADLHLRGDAQRVCRSVRTTPSARPRPSRPRSSATCSTTPSCPGSAW